MSTLPHLPVEVRTLHSLERVRTHMPTKMLLIALCENAKLRRLDSSGAFVSSKSRCSSTMGNQFEQLLTERSSRIKVGQQCSGT